MRKKMQLTPVAALIVVVALSACASTTQRVDRAADEPPTAQTHRQASAQRLAQALDALRKGEPELAITNGQALVLEDLRSAPAHLVLAAGYHLNGGQSALDLADSGYKTAAQFAGQSFWSDYLAGVVAIQRHQAAVALEHFAAAALNAPDQPFVFEGLAAAAYLGGQLPLAEAAAQRAQALAPDSRIGWQLLTLVRAAQGQEANVSHLLNHAPASVDAAQQKWVGTRAAQLIRTTLVENAAPNRMLAQLTPAPAAQTTPAFLSPQITVDVTVILSDERNTSAYGVNLLDGLQGIYSFAKSAQTVYSSAGDGSQTTITRAIRTPDITYNLNIFNRGGRFYEAIARPSLTAFAGETSTFFIGEQIVVNLPGIQSAQLERINVGVSLKITPADIRPDGSRFRVEVDRGFFSDQNNGSFKEALSTFKQSVAATADVKFGETLILSGLSESVTDGANSRTPVLGDVPGVDALFSRSTKLKRTRSAIILVTPSLPGFVNRTVNRSEKIDRLIHLWDTVIEPRVGTQSLIERAKDSPSFTRPAAGDVHVRDLQDPVLRQALVDDIRRMTQSL